MKAIFLAVISIFLVGCASHKAAEKEIAERTEKSQTTDSKTLGGTIQELIQNSTTLSVEQKDKLNKIMDENKKTAADLYEKTYKVRGVLVEELLAAKPDLKKVRILKKKIRKIEAQRLKNTFDTIQKFTNIVVKDENRQKFIDQLSNIDRR